MLGGDLNDRRVCGQSGWSAHERRAEGEERHEGDLALGSKLDQVIVLALDDVVGVLDLGDVDKLERVLHLLLIDVGEPDQVELALLAQVLEGAQLLLELYGGVVAGPGTLGCPPDGDCQIGDVCTGVCDWEGNTKVQAYWSEDDKACVIPKIVLYK